MEAELILRPIQKPLDVFTVRKEHERRDQNGKCGRKRVADGDDWHKTGERFQYLQSQGFRIFASVGVNSFSYIKPDISAVICDRLHPDGTTLRHSRSRYLQFYNAEDIIDLSVRPDLGVDW